ncbi:MAG: hypothetical protein WC364_08920 [Eubacteriales bacterium]|jgi:hypothetical protein
MKRLNKLSLLIIILCSLSLLAYAGSCYRELSKNGQTPAANETGGIKSILPFIPWPHSEKSRDTGASTVKPGTGVQTPSGAASGDADKEKEIQAYYTKKLVAVASGYQQKLNSLVAAGWSEYEKVRKNEAEESLISLARKYLSAGHALEAQCDAEFYPILDEYKAELEKNSLSQAAAVNAGREYKNAKAARKKQVLSSAAKYIGLP